MTQICFATTIFLETNFSVPKNIKHSIWFLVVSTTRIKLRMSIESREEFKNGMLAHRPVALANNVTTKNTGFNAVIVGKNCIQVTGNGYK